MDAESKFEAVHVTLNLVQDMLRALDIEGAKVILLCLLSETLALQCRSEADVDLWIERASDYLSMSMKKHVRERPYVQ
mgnify:CR=1 FL=1